METINIIQSWFYYFTDNKVTVSILIALFSMVPIFLYGIFIFGSKHFERISGVIIEKVKEKRPSISEYLALTIRNALMNDNTSGKSGVSEKKKVRGPYYVIYILQDNGKVKRCVIPRNKYNDLPLYSRVQKGWGKSYYTINIIEEDVKSPAVKDNGNTLTYFKFVTLLAFRNLLFACGIVVLVIAIFGMKNRIVYEGDLSADTWIDLPFEVSQGARLLIQLQQWNPEDVVRGNLILKSTENNDALVQNSFFFSGNDDSYSTDDLLVDITQSMSLQVRVETVNRSQFRLVVVIAPEPVLGYFFLMIVAFSFAFYCSVVRLRMSQIDLDSLTRAATMIGNIILKAAFIMAFFTIFCAGWYLVCNAIDHFFNTGIWLTYDHFIQDIFSRIF